MTDTMNSKSEEFWKKMRKFFLLPDVKQGLAGTIVEGIDSVVQGRPSRNMFSHILVTYLPYQEYEEEWDQVENFLRMATNRGWGENFFLQLLMLRSGLDTFQSIVRLDEST